MIRTKKYITGNYMEMEVFTLPRGTKPLKRQKKIEETAPAQKRLNNKRARRYLVRITHLNFTRDDLALDLTFDNQHLPEGKEGVQKEVRNYIKRLRRWRKANDMPDLKYIYVISNRDQEGRETRWHVHMFLSGMDRDIAEAKWGKGTANAGHLQFTETGVEGRVIYMMRQADEGERRWCGSQNLLKPEAIISDHKVTRAKLDHMALAPDDRAYIEKIINGRKREWTLTDCSVECDGRQLTIDGIPTDNGFGGVSLLIRARRSTSE